jgi:hypothetical protein
MRGSTRPKEVDMIEIRRTGGGEPLEFEVVVRLSPAGTLRL